MANQDILRRKVHGNAVCPYFVLDWQEDGLFQVLLLRQNLSQSRQTVAVKVVRLTKKKKKEKRKPQLTSQQSGISYEIHEM